MLVWEDGPLNIFELIRETVGIRFDFEGDRFVPPHMGAIRKMFGGVFICVYCMSIWWAFGFAILYLFINSFIAVALAVPFALSAGAIAINRLCDYG